MVCMKHMIEVSPRCKQLLESLRDSSFPADKNNPEDQLTLGDLVLINAFMIQLYIPLNFLGVLYREIKQSIADMEKLFSLLEKSV